MSVSQPPECVSIVVCDFILEDRRSSNKTLVGLFNGITAVTTPVIHPRLFIMASLSDGRGNHSITIALESPAGKRILEVEGDIDFKDPLVVHDLVFEIVNLVLPEFGEYYVGVYRGANRLGSRRFTLLKTELEDASAG